MSLGRIRSIVAAAIADALERHTGQRPDDIALEIPPRRDLGDLAWPGALPLAKTLRRPPREIAQLVLDGVAWPEEVGRVEVAGPGFVNVFLDRSRLLVALLDGGSATRGPVLSTVVEHTNINPNKAAHIGHLRNAVLGDILVRCLRHLGHPVEVQNYVDDTGVQVADVVVGLLHLPEEELAAALGAATARRDDLIGQFILRMPDEVPPASTDDFDDLCWDIYPRVTARYEADEEFKAHRGEVLHMIEGGPGDMSLDQALYLIRGTIISANPYPARAVARLAAAIADGNLRCHLATMARLGVGYDLLPHESDILALGFWSQAFELLKATGAVRLETDGKNAGCWVMSLRSSPDFADMDDPDKILVRSNGTVTYTAKDIAYQLWKLGLLRSADGSRHDFSYRRFASWHQGTPAAPVGYGDGDRPLYRTAATGTDDAVSFGGADRVYNVIDVRQSYPQKVVREAVRALGHPREADRSIHFAYEMVALTPAAVRVVEERTGASFDLSPEAMSKAYVEMSGRRGIGVKADEFLDALESAAADAIRSRTEGDVPGLGERAHAIAVGALRYLMARQSRNRVLAFDFDDALAFEGDTGPYLQYSAVRATKIFDKLSGRRGEGRVTAEEAPGLAGQEVPDDLWELVLACARRDEAVEQAVTNLEFSLLAQHVHSLAQLFHKLYHAHPVMAEEDDDVRLLRRAVFTLFLGEIRQVLEELLGIPVPEEM